MDACSVSGRVPEHTENPLYQIGESALLAPLALGLEGIDCQHGNISGQGFVDKQASIIG